MHEVGSTSPPPPAAADRERWRGARAFHEGCRDRFQRRVDELERMSRRLSMLRLGAFLTALVGPALRFGGSAPAGIGLGILGVVAFFGAVIAHRRVLAAQQAARARRDIHERHVLRAAGGWTGLPAPSDPEAKSHPYSEDIDLAGPGSLLQRIDTTRTVFGERTLLRWLSAAAPADVIVERQAAVAELGAAAELRQELEAAVPDPGPDGKKPSAERFFDFVKQPSFIVGWRRTAAVALPAAALLLLVGRSIGVLRGPAWGLLLVPQIVFVASSWRTVTARFELVDARRAQLEAFGTVMSVLERASFRAGLLHRLQQALQVDGRPPSHHMAVLARWTGWADLRFQVLVHPILNLFLMWDWHVLWGLERWNRAAGVRVRGWLEAVGEFEALASLSVLHALDRTCFPTIVPAEDGLRAVELGHPLITQTERVNNDLRIEGPGHVVIVTGSNMAGKSTLLRAVGLNVALALAGGPVCADEMSLPLVRLRSSMRVSDSLQSGASYFYSELVKLKTVVADADSGPPIFFLFDELLRGTNAKARRIGATAIVLHLLSRRAMGLVATHDDAFSRLEERPRVRATNVHMTDVIVDGEMVFDYRLRPGPATTSNALRLLHAAGIALPPDDRPSSPEQPLNREA